MSGRQTGAVSSGDHVANRRSGHPGKDRTLLAEWVVCVLLPDDASPLEQPDSPRVDCLRDLFDVLVRSRWRLDEERFFRVEGYGLYEFDVNLRFCLSEH